MVDEVFKDLDKYYPHQNWHNKIRSRKSAYEGNAGRPLGYLAKEN